jgi:hypothetical protein
MSADMEARFQMSSKPPIFDYEPIKLNRVTRVWGISRPIWVIVAGSCAFVEFAGWFATDGRINGWGDVTFVAAFAAIGLIALMNAIRPIWKA